MITTHELARQLLEHPDRNAAVEVILGGEVHIAPVSTWSVGDEDVNNTNFIPGDLAVTVEI
jgi:hypothetical protein